eukprot:g8025.t1
MPTSRVGGPIPTQARQGRQNQKYSETGERLLAGCIPYRVIKTDAINDVDYIEVLLVTRRNGEGWVIPKGGWESDEDDVEHAARRETVEEAGVRGVLDDPVLGRFQFQSNKKGNCISKENCNCCVYVFAMRVVEELDFWPEATVRKRMWFPIKEAHKLCSWQWMRDAIMILIQRENSSGVIRTTTTPPPSAPPSIDSATP